MELKLLSKNGKQFLEGFRHELLVANVSAVNSILEICFGHGVKRLMLYSENLTHEFFDLSSGMAGTLIQKFRNYGIRVAMVLSPKLEMSRRFGEVIAEENDGTNFRFFNERDSAEEWLCRS